MESTVKYKVKRNVRKKRFDLLPAPMFGSFSFINISIGKEVENGIRSMVESALTFRILHLLYKECASSKHDISIAVLSSYPPQVLHLQQKLQNHFQNNNFFKLKVGSCAQAQGGEEEEVDVMIISTVGPKCITSPHNTIVDLRRARHCLWVLGDERLHLNGGSIWEPLILDAKARQCFFEAHEHKELAKVIIEVNQDLHQLDDLVKGEITLFQNTTCKVSFSSDFRSSFSKIESWETKKLVLLMLLKLSNGWRPKGSSTAVYVTQSRYSELIKEFKVRGMHLICTVDIDEETYHTQTQVLKVWDILPFHEIKELVRRLEGIFELYTPEYIDLCKARCQQRGTLVFPVKWSGTSKIIRYKSRASCVENINVRESLILKKFYSLSSGMVNNMISGCDGGDIALPFELTGQEKEVVSFDKSSFVLGRSGTGKTTVLTMKLFQNEQLHHLACEGFHEVLESKEQVKQDALHQLFVTFSPKLCYAVKKQFSEWKRFTCGGSSSDPSSAISIHDIDKMTLSEDIPNHFLRLPDDMYPLIITFHKFLLILDGTMGTSYFERFPSIRSKKARSSRLVDLEQYMRSKDVTYERFCSLYWHHFNQKLIKSLDPATVYTEIMSVIKGGESLNGILPRDDYVALCDGRTSILDARKREYIYDVFLQYEKKKTENGDFDLADLVNDLHRRLDFEGYKGDSIDYVYVDEVQDLSMRQIALFKYVCANVDEGFAFCGDTAQAIAKGIAFRFEDIRCLFFKKFLSGPKKGQMGKIFQLSQNFRTHAGVLNLAQSVIGLLCHYFPLFVDSLSPETSRISGELPILLETDIDDDAVKTIFGRKEGDGCQQMIGFGAEQVVLVRDGSLKEKVVEMIGENALVLTIMESKGLEFHDVLLYDFFTTSAFSNEWRIIHEYMKEKGLPSSFNMEKHVVLCSELKQLYVAITRTRQRIWICETSGFCHPMYDYWKKSSLVDVKLLSDSFAEKMQVQSSKHEWKQRGVKLFCENNFRMARMCFLKAGDKDSERLCEAYDLRAIAESIPASRLERKKLLKDAAVLFTSVAKNELAAQCLYEIEDYKAAGDLYHKESMLEKAGNCFYLAKYYELAAEVYEQAGAIAMCLSACADGKLFETGFEVIGRWGGCGDAGQKFFWKGALHYFGVKDFTSMMKFVRSFHSKEKMRTFLNEKHCLVELISLEIEWGNVKEAVKLARTIPDPVLKADLLFMCGHHRESSLIILWHVFLNSPIFHNSDESLSQKDELLAKAVWMAKRDSDFFCQFVYKEAETLSKGDTHEELLKCGLEFVCSCKANALAVNLKTADEIKRIEKDVVNELRLLKEVHGEFVEAAKIDVEDDYSIKAALTRLWYAFFGSLWAHGKRALPLKDFMHKDKLLEDAMSSCVNCHPYSQDSELVHIEIRMLSSVEISLSQMWSYLKQTPKARCLRTHFLISRSILDVHLNTSCRVYALHEIWNDNETTKCLEEVLSNDIVAVESLVYFWNHWKEMILELIKWSFTWGYEGGKVYEDFVFNYFGLRKYDRYKNGSYVVLNADAQWVKQTKPCMFKNRYLYMIRARDFSSVASRYWCSELLFVAEKVVRKLQSFQNFSMHQQNKVLSSMYKVAKSLQKCELPYDVDRANQIVDRSLQQCVDQLWSNIFHINWKIAQSEEMMFLRGNKMFLEDAINRMIKSHKGLTCAQLGRIAMTFLGSRIEFDDDIKRKLSGCSSIYWRDLFEKLNSSSENCDLAVSLINVLKETRLCAGWYRVDDRMSASCFVYLMERLLILSFCFRGRVFTTRSSCVEWLEYDQERGLSSNGACSDTIPMQMQTIHHSLALMVSEILSTSQADLMEWITTSKEEESYAVLVLRLTVLLSLICANSGQHYVHLFDLLEHSNIVSLLPSVFREALIKGIKEDNLVDAVGVGCEEMDNPLVIMSFTEDLAEFSCENAIFLDMTKLYSQRERLVEVLYPEKLVCAGHDRVARESAISFSQAGMVFFNG